MNWKKDKQLREKEFGMNPQAGKFLRPGEHLPSPPAPPPPLYPQARKN